MENMLLSPPPRRSEPAGTAAKVDKLARRLADIIALVYQGSNLDKHKLAERFGVSVRTIERDLGQRLTGIIECINGDWRLCASRRDAIFARLLDNYADMAGVQHVFPDNSLPWLIGQLETPAEQRGLHVHPAPEENIAPQLFDALQAAVQQHYLCYFTYSGKPREVHPYNLIRQHDAWYLAAFEPGANLDHPKAFRLTRIKALRVDESTTFQPEQRHLNYLASQSDIWFTARSTRVMLRVAAPVAHYFRQRNLLPQQTTQKSTGDSLIVTASINHPTQLLPVVRFWMPHLRIIEPREWEQTLIEELRQTLQAWGAAETPEQPAKKTAPAKRAKNRK